MMIPQIDNMDFVTMQGVEERPYPSLTYRMAIEEERIVGMVDDKDAMRQAIYKRINTERDVYPIYRAYGMKKKDLFGKPKPYAFVVLMKRIRDSLMEDDRVVDVVDFLYDHEQSKDNDLTMSFTVKTVYGNVEMKGVNVFGGAY